MPRGKLALFSMLERMHMTEKVKDRYMTMRLPADVERELRKMAEANTRTLAAQILHYVKQGLAKEVKA